MDHVVDHGQAHGAILIGVDHGRLTGRLMDADWCGSRQAHGQVHGAMLIGGRSRQAGGQAHVDWCRSMQAHGQAHGAIVFLGRARDLDCVLVID